MQIETKQEFDQNLYSRQAGTYGVETMNKFVKMRVLILGLGGVGLELAKNLILAGPKSVTIYDPAALTQRDLEYNFYASEKDVASGCTRAQAALPKLAELNNYVDVEPLNCGSFEEILSQDVLGRFDVVVVTDWYNMEVVQRLNEACHSLKKGFIFCAAAGLAGCVFVDFGSSHVINDKDGEECFTSLVSNITEEGIVNTHENQRHNLLEGDLIKFTELIGMEALNGHPLRVQKVISPYSFSVGPLHQLNVGRYVRNGIINQMKEPKTVVYKTLRESVQNMAEQLIDCDFDWENEQRVSYMKTVVTTFWAFISEYGFPDFYDTDAFQKFEKVLYNKLEAFGKTEEWKHLAGLHIHKLFFNLAAGQFSPVQGFFGSIAAQEIVKFTGKYTPIEQWFVHEWYWAAFKKMPFENFLKNKQDVLQNLNNRYVSHIALLGKKVHDQMLASNVFMVGAGALGCEYLKLFSMIGLCCGSGQLTVTDDDTIEVSNLNRQFLFRREHINASKSETACGEANKMNKFLKVVPKKNRVSSETEDIFTDCFWDSLNFVVNAVDNIKARQYVDQKCVLHEKPLFEAGTLGTKCNSQLVLPGLTEAYSDSQDPQEKQVPMCTMRSFPFLIDHCIEWARAKFFDMFVQISQFLKEFFDNTEKGVAKFEKELRNNVSTVKELCDNLEGFLPLLQNPSPEMFVKFARDFYQYAFHDQIAQLLTSFPEDARDKEGNLFWTSPKRPPMIVPFDINNQEHLSYILTIVKILQQFLIPHQPIQLNQTQLHEILMKIPVKQIQIDNSEEAKAKLINEAANPSDPNSDIEKLRSVCTTLVQISKMQNGLRFEELEF